MTVVVRQMYRRRKEGEGVGEGRGREDKVGPTIRVGRTSAR
jgi:hypothetical protein